MKTLASILLVSACLGASTANGAIRRVPSQYPTIQSAINSSAETDTVLVSEGTYYENISYLGKRIIVGSQFIVDNDTSHITRTIINGSQPASPDSGSVVFFVSGEDTNSVLCGFTITGGTGTVFLGSYRGGGGILCFYAGARIQHNRIAGNSISHDNDAGGGICTIGGPGVIVDHNQILNNSVVGLSVAAGGGGIHLNGNGLVYHNLITDNIVVGQGLCAVARGGGVSTNGFVTASVQDNIIAGNSVTSTVQMSHRDGGGLSIWNTASISVISNTVCCNRSDSSAGGIYLDASSHLMAFNNIVWGDTAAQEITVEPGGVARILYSDVQGGWPADSGNIDVNPRFLLDGTYRLSDSSSCIGAGRDSVQIEGVWYRSPSQCFYGGTRPSPLGTRPDIGACENRLALPEDVNPYEHGGPRSFELVQNYPNPFNPVTNIRFSIVNRQLTILKVYDVLGREVATLANEVKQPGRYSVQWEASGLASGVYFYRLEAGNFMSVKKLMLLR